MQSPRLIFFCELDTAALTTLFAQPDLLRLLQTHRYGVALAVAEFSAERAAAVRALNAHQIPVIGWLLLPPQAGYWFNLQNYPHAIAAYRAFQRWVTSEQLTFSGVGLDIEPSLNDVQAAQERPKGALFERLWHARHNALFPAARVAYTELVVNMRHDGYTVYGYQLPFLIDDRRANSTLIQRMFDVLDLPVDEEVLKCYSSLLPQDWFGNDLNGAFVQSYGIHADSLAIGSSGGGVVLDPVTGAKAARLDWAAFERDLRIAARYSSTVHVFSLEGCVEQGWLERLPLIDWQERAHVPWRSRLLIRSARSTLAVVLWWARWWVAVLGWLGWLVGGWLLLKHHLPTWLRRLFARTK